MNHFRFQNRSKISFSPTRESGINHNYVLAICRAPCPLPPTSNTSTERRQEAAELETKKLGHHAYPKDSSARVHFKRMKWVLTPSFLQSVALPPSVRPNPETLFRISINIIQNNQIEFEFRNIILKIKDRFISSTRRTISQHLGLYSPSRPTYSRIQFSDSLSSVPY